MTIRQPNSLNTLLRRFASESETIVLILKTSEYSLKFFILGAILFLLLFFIFKNLFLYLDLRYRHYSAVPHLEGRQVKGNYPLYNESSDSKL